MQATAAHYEPRTGRFDVTLQIANDNGDPALLRFTGRAIETVEVAVLTRNVERTDILKSGDVVVERRPRAEVGADAASREQALGMQMRRPARGGQPLRLADLTRPDLVQRDQTVTIIYQTAGIYLTTRGKALDSGTEGDVVTVLNPQSKRTISGVVTAVYKAPGEAVSPGRAGGKVAISAGPDTHGTVVSSPGGDGGAVSVGRRRFSQGIRTRARSWSAATSASPAPRSPSTS